LVGIEESSLCGDNLFHLLLRLLPKPKPDGHSKMRL
jgi:hypothetical protein